jgi:hypothetical protein
MGCDSCDDGYKREEVIANLYDHKVQKLRHEITLSSRAGVRSATEFNGNVKYPFSYLNGYKPDPRNVRGVIVGLKTFALPSASPATSGPDAVEAIVVRLRNFNNSNSTWFCDQASSVTANLNPHGLNPTGILGIIAHPTARALGVVGNRDWLYQNTGDAITGGIYGQTPFNNIQIELLDLNGYPLKIGLTENWICTLVVQFLVDDLSLVK